MYFSLCSTSISSGTPLILKKKITSITNNKIYVFRRGYYIQLWNRMEGKNTDQPLFQNSWNVFCLSLYKVVVWETWLKMYKEDLHLKLSLPSAENSSFYFSTIQEIIPSSYKNLTKYKCEKEDTSQSYKVFPVSSTLNWLHDPTKN